MRYWLYVLPMVFWMSACESGTSITPEPAKEQVKLAAAPAQQKTTKPPEQSYSYMTMHTVKDDPLYVIDSIKGAIGDRGIKINGINYIGKMLDRTAEAVGATKKIYTHAQAMNFCSSTLSRDTMEADPHNIAFCPYIITVYELRENPGTVHIVYRKPLVVGNKQSKAALKAIGDLLDGIVDDAIR